MERLTQNTDMPPTDNMCSRNMGDLVLVIEKSFPVVLFVK